MRGFDYFIDHKGISFVRAGKLPNSAIYHCVASASRRFAVARGMENLLSNIIGVAGRDFYNSIL